MDGVLKSNYPKEDAYDGWNAERSGVVSKPSKVHGYFYTKVFAYAL